MIGKQFGRWFVVGFLICSTLISLGGWFPGQIQASSVPSIIDVGITAETYLPPETFLRARPGDRFTAWYDIAYSGPRLRIQTKTTIIDPNGKEIHNALGDQYLVLMEDTPEHTGWIGPDFEIPDTAVLGTYDVKFSTMSEDGAQEYDSIIRSGWLELFSGDEPDIRAARSSIDFTSTVVGEDRNGGFPIWNDGTATLTINSIQRTSGSSDFTHLEPTTPCEVPPGNSQYITIKFAPSSEGSKSAVFTINSNDPDETNITFSVSGSGITQTGNIEVTSEPSGFPFELNGPMEYSSPTPWSYDSAPLGTYTITWPPISGYQAPPQETKTLMQGETISFHGEYSPIQETISTPDRPSGPTSGTTGTNYTYTTGGSLSSLENDIEYLFDWGDGHYSDWSSEPRASHAWINPGTYTVKALARSATHTDILSSWSPGLTVDVNPVSPTTIDCSPSQFSFNTPPEEDPPNQTLNIKNSGSAELDWSVTDDSAWLVLNPTSGTSSGETDTVTVSVSASGMEAGNYSATITITAPDAANTPLTIPVNLTIEPPQAGAINVTSNPPGASFSLSGPINYNGITPWNSTELPAGTYTITWNPIDGYQTPQQQNEILEQGGVISFHGEYPPTKGTIEVTSDPSGAPFTLSGPANYSGVTPWNETDVPIGSYTITWGFVEGHETPPKEDRPLTTGETVVFHGIYQQVNGAIEVTSEPSGASFSLSGPENYRDVTPWRKTSAPVGTYTITWGFMGDVYETPQQNSKELVKGDTITFHGKYTTIEVFRGENATTLWDYYSAWDKQLPPLSERAKIYEALKLGSASEYTGTAEQNTRLLNALKESQICPLTGEDVGWKEASRVDVNELGETIDRRLRQNVIYPPYLLDPDTFTSTVSTVWNKFTSWITQTELTKKYDELYLSGIDYDALRFNTLIKARNCLKDGDALGAQEYLEKSNVYNQLSGMSFRAANDIFIGNLEAGEMLAEGIKEGCEASVKLGLAVVNPTAGKVVDYLYIGTDYAIDRLIGEEDATKDAIVKIAVTSIFNEVKFKEFDNRTLADYTNNRLGKVTFPLLQKAFQREEVQFTLSRIIKHSVIELGESAAEKVTTLILDELGKTVDVKKIEVKSPVELRVYDSHQQVTGLVNGEVKHGLPMSVYDNGIVTVFFPTGSYRYEVAGVDEGTYALEINSLEEGETRSLTLNDIPTSAKAVHQYAIDWETLAAGKKGVTAKIDSDGDGTFEEIKKIGQESTGLPWVWIVVAGVSGLLGVFAGAFIVRRRINREKPISNY
jgi:hypothetical protein